MEYLQVFSVTLRTITPTFQYQVSGGRVLFPPKANLTCALIAYR